MKKNIISKIQNGIGNFLSEHKILMEKYRKRKNRFSSGESIAEVLAASLMISLAMTALISMVMASFRMIKNSEASMNSYFEYKNQYETKTNLESNTKNILIKIGDSEDPEIRYEVPVYYNVVSSSKFLGYELSDS